MADTPTVDDKRVKDVSEYLRAGHYMERAARMANINPSTVYVWKQKGESERQRVESGEEPTEAGQKYLAILELVEKAQEAAAHRAMLSIQKAAQDGSWQAAAWYLERTDSQHYGRKTILVGNNDGPVQVQAVTPEEVDAKLRLLIGAAEASERERAGKPQQIT